MIRVLQTITILQTLYLVKQFKAFRVFETEHGFEHRIVELPIDSLPKNEVLIRVAYSGVNYKDLLSSRGNKGITRNYPHTPGIDASGIVESDSSNTFKTGDEVVVMGYDLGMNTHGGFSEYISVPAAWIMPLPKGLSLHAAMSVGTSGFTAALGIIKMLRCGQTPQKGPVIVSGATGGVGSFAVAMLAKLGFEVWASTGKVKESDYLLSLGASKILDRNEVEDTSGKPLLRQRWAGAFDTVGGNTLISILKACSKEACVATCGNVTGASLALTSFPFILNGVNLLGINAADTPMAFRKEIWRILVQDWQFVIPNQTEKIISLVDLESALTSLEKGINKGRYLLKL